MKNDDSVDILIWLAVPLNFTDKQENIVEEREWWQSVSIFLKKDAITCFIFLAKNQGLVTFESLKMLSGMMQSLATGNWVLISERLILVIGSSRDHPQFCLSNTGARGAVVVSHSLTRCWKCPQVSPGPLSSENFSFWKQWGIFTCTNCACSFWFCCANYLACPFFRQVP